MMTNPTRREALEYIAPVILTLVARPAFAAKGSGRNQKSGKPTTGKRFPRHGIDHLPRASGKEKAQARQ